MIGGALLAGAALLLRQADAGYVRERTSDGEHCLRWPISALAHGGVTFVQSAIGDFRLGSGFFDAISRAQETWAAQGLACSSLSLLEGARSWSRTTGYDPQGKNENLIIERTVSCRTVVPPDDPCRATESCGNRYDCWDQGDGLLAITLLTYDRRGVLLDADVEMNGVISYPTLVDAPPCVPGAISRRCVGNDVQNTITHEMGHALGLAHSPDPASTMFATAPLGETSKRVLDPASREFICDVYPLFHASLDCHDPAATGGGGGTGGSETGVAGNPIAPATVPGPGCASTGAPPGTAPTWIVLGALLRRRRRATP